MDKAAIEARATKVIAEILGLGESAITPTSRIIWDLNADSLDQVEIIMGLEDEFGIEIDDDDNAMVSDTVQQAFDALAAHPALA